MKARTNWILISFLGAVLVAGAAWSFAQAPSPEPTPNPEEDALPGAPGWGAPDPMGMMGPEGMMEPDLREELGLTDEQAEKLHALHVEHMKSNIRSRSDLMIRRIELEELMRADTPDRAAIDQKVRRLSEAQTAMLRQQIEHRLAMHDLLTPEQRTKAQTLMRRHMQQRMFHGREMRGPQGRGFGPGRGFSPRWRGMGRGPGGPRLD